ncbi:MAG TPA: lycopene cyclase family protein [Chitinophagaceae bacterium]
MINHFNYIITGSGCAGLSLLYRMMQHWFFDNKQILIIDQSLKTINDRTWCFWEQKPNLFEGIVYHKWKQLDFYSDLFSARFDILPYEYKMIRGIDFYNYVLEKANQCNNIHFYYGEVQSVATENNRASVTVDQKHFSADYIFNSILLHSSHEENNFYHLLQHFKGWLIETSSAIFDERIATFMDFRLSQEQETCFAYVLPLSSGHALVEYTVISKQVPGHKECDEALKKYISEFLKLKDYTIKEEESGVIPMTNYPFSKGEGRIVNIGTAGQQTKASSGFTFSFIQKHSDAIIRALVNNKSPYIKSSILQKRFHLYDSTLLNILHNKKMRGDEIFAHLFKNNPPQRVLKFLDNETSFSEELKIMNSVPTKIFFPAIIHELF